MYDIEFLKQYERFYPVLAVLSIAGVGALFQQLSFKKKRLEKALDEIQRFNKTKDFFFGVIAHDLRRPLNTLFEMAELADFYIKTQRYEELKKVSTAIDRSSYRIRQLLDNMLNWALSQEGRYSPRPVNVASKVNEVVELYTQTILSHRIHVACDCPGFLTVFADENGFELIMRNLVDNALKYLPAEGILSIEASETSSGDIQIIIGDNGKGMDQEILTQVRYILAHADTLIPGQISRSLGMLLVGKFAKINKGTVEVNSQLETGTVVTLLLPGCKTINLLLK